MQVLKLISRSCVKNSNLSFSQGADFLPRVICIDANEQGKRSYNEGTTKNSIFKTTSILLMFFYMTASHAYKIQADILVEANTEVQKHFEDFKKEMELNNQKIKSMREIEEKAKIEKELMTQLLHSQGYYAGTIDTRIYKISKNRVKVNFFINPKQSFTVSNIYLQAGKGTKIPSIDILDIKVNDLLLAQKVLDAEKTLSKKIEDLNCLANINVSHQAVLDFKAHTAELYFKVAYSPQVVWGKTYILGLKTIKEKYVYRDITWEEGECFKPSKIKKFRSKMLLKPVFADATVQYSDTPINTNQIPITVELTEKEHRTIRLGAGYHSDKGPGFYGSWEHRNFFGMAELLKFESTVNQRLQNLKTTYTNPFLGNKDQSLIIQSELKHEDTNKYESSSWSSSANIRRRRSKYWSFQYGIGHYLTQVRELSKTENFGLLYLPINLTFDSRNNILDPAKGLYFKFESAPYWDLFDTSTIFYKSRADLNHYWALNESNYTILAARTALGSIAGSSRALIPADLRFYAGGGQSVRGYEYQSLGRLVDNEAQGGRSLIEVSTEIRQKITDTYGFVVFLDGGNIFDEKIPDFSLPIRWAAGFGLRYFTSFGPLRFDVGMPIRKREGIDDSYQIYISIGQSY